MAQTLKKYGSRISIIGLWQEGKSFEYALAQGGFKGKSYIKVMNWIADKAEAQLKATGKLTVIVQDNSPIHKSKEVRACWQGWSRQARGACWGFPSIRNHVREDYYFFSCLLIVPK